MTQELITISPIDGSVAVRRPYASSAEIQAALTRAKLAQSSWRSMPLATRAALVTSAVEALVSHKDAIAEELTRQMGRPIRYTPGEVDGFEAPGRPLIAIAAEGLAAGGASALG